MKNRLRTPRELFARLHTNLGHLTRGGSWAIQLPAETQHNLRWFFWDGVLSAGSDAINLTYQTLYILALGATNAQIGLMSALSNLSATAMLIPGAMLADRQKRRKPVVLIAGGGAARLSILLLALLPFAFAGHAAVYVAIGLNILMAGFSNLSLPAWVSLTGDIIPLTWRGRYFGTRNLIMGVSSMVITLLAGQLITKLGASIPVYQVAFGLAFLIGMTSTYSYAQIREPAGRIPDVAQAYSLKSLFRTLQGDPNFLVYCLYAMLWNFSLNIAGPFFTVYQVQTLKASAFMIGLVSIVSSLSGMPGQRLFGQLNDRWGPRKVILVTGGLIPFVPALWYFTRAEWHAIPINLLSGFLWAGYGLASFNFLLAISTEENRARYSAMAQIAATISAAVGASLGGVMASKWGIPVVFLVSGAGRAIAAGVFTRFVRGTEGSNQIAVAGSQPATDNGEELEGPAPELVEIEPEITESERPTEASEMPAASGSPPSAVSDQLIEDSEPGLDSLDQESTGSDDAPSEDDQPAHSSGG